MILADTLEPASDLMETRIACANIEARRALPKANPEDPKKAGKERKRKRSCMMYITTFE